MTPNTFDQTAPEVRTLVTHQWPDTDAWVCLWIALRFTRNAGAAKIVFVNAGESLFGSEGDPSVLHFDTGGGDFDQHGKSLKRASSAMLFAQHLEIQDDPGLKALLELTVVADNAEPIAPTDLHYIIVGLPRSSSHQDAQRQPDWNKVQKTVFDMFDIIYGQESGRQQSQEDLSRFGKRHTLPNGLCFTTVLGYPRLRDAAFKDGADVVLWTEPKGKNGFYVGVQVNRDSRVKLSGVAASLRLAEAKARGINVDGQRLDYMERREPVPNWFLHDTLTTVLCGSRKWALTVDEFTRLTEPEIYEAVKRALERIPEQVVRRRR